MIANWVESYNRDDFYLWVIIDKGSGELIGIVTIPVKDDENREYEVGLSFCQRFWGKRLALESVNAVSGYMKSLGYTKMKVFIDPDNKKCMQAIKHDNLEFIGEERRKFSDGTEMNLNVFIKRYEKPSEHEFTGCSDL